MNLLTFLESLSDLELENDLFSGFSTAREFLHLLNWATECLDEDEIYCQIGSKGGDYLVGALVNHPQILAYLIEPNVNTDLDTLLASLAQFGLEEQVNFFQQSSSEFFTELRDYRAEIKIGLYCCQGCSNYRLQLLRLQLIRPFLADQAVIIITDIYHSSVKQALGDFLLLNPEANLEQSNSEIFYYILSWDTNKTSSLNYLEIQEKFYQNSLLDKLSHFEEEIIESLYQQAEEYHQNGEITQAQESYCQAINLNPKLGDSWFRLGLLYSQNHQLQEALRMFIKAIEQDFKQGIYHYQLGLVFEKLKQLDFAVQAYRNSLEVQSNLSEVYNQLGSLYYRIGQVEEAEEIYRQGQKIAPNFVSILINLGNTLLVKGDIDEAIKLYQRAQAITPERREITENFKLAEELLKFPNKSIKYRGDYFYEKKIYCKAISNYAILLELGEADSYVYYRLGEGYEKTQKEEKANEIYEAGLIKYPQDFSLNFALILNLQKNVGDIEGAIKAAERAISNNPNNLDLQFEAQRLLPLIYQSTEEIDIYRNRFTKELERLITQVSLETAEEKKAAKDALSHHTNFFLAYQGRNDLELQKSYGELICRIMQANYPQWSQKLVNLAVSERIKVGYISAYIYKHAITKYSLGWLKHHDREKFKIYGYYTESYQDSTTEEYKTYCDTFHHIPQDLEGIARQILADQLDILVFLDLGMHPKTLQLGGLKLAPIQCMGWGHPVTSGLPTIDYYLSPDLMEPDNAQEHYREELVRLPNLGMVLSKPIRPEQKMTSADFNLPQDKVIYLCCQSLWKYLPQYDYLFAEIARQVYNSHFVFFCHYGQGVTSRFQKRLEKVFTEYGLNWPEYCQFSPLLKYEQYLQLNQLSDIFLDSFAWSGGITSLDAISCYLPIVTSPGEFMRGRQAYALLKRLGIEETIAINEREYIEIAVRLGLDSQWRSQIREKIRDSEHLIFEDTTCVRGLEAFYRTKTA